MAIKSFIFIIFLVSSLYSQNYKQIDFTKSEQEWLSKKQSIKYVYDPDWKPFEWRDELGEHAGIISDIILLLKEKSGIDFISVPTKS